MVGGLNTHQLFILPNGPICGLDTTESSQIITSQSCGDLQLGGISLTASRIN